VVVLSNAAKGECCCFFNGWIELFKTVDKSVECSRVDNGFGEVG
jgi:hypothetical protein